MRLSRMIKNIARGLTIGLIAATGFGLLYLLAKTEVIKEGFRGLSYDKGELKILEPGIHLLLSPLHHFDTEMPVNKDEMVRLREFEIKTADSVAAIIQADYMYRIDDPKKAILSVGNYKEAVNESVKGAISSILQEQRYDQLTLSAAVDTKNRGQALDLESKTQASSLSLSANTSRESGSIQDNFFEKIKSALNAVCAKWGISISRLRLISVDAKDSRISGEIAETALSHLRARNQLVAAKATAESVRISAEAKANATTIIAKGEADAQLTIARSKVSAVSYAAKNLPSTQEQEIYRLQVGLDAARAIGATTGTVAFGTNPLPFFSRQHAGNNMSGEVRHRAGRSMSIS